MSAVAKVAAFRAGLDADTASLVAALRDLIAGAHPDLVEDYKWNAPSFTHGGDHCVTLGLERKGGVRMVLHRGAKVQDVGGFAFADPAGLARWAAPDRGVLLFMDAGQVEAKADALRDLIRRWVDVN